LRLVALGCDRLAAAALPEQLPFACSMENRLLDGKRFLFFKQDFNGRNESWVGWPRNVR
jgi:hypothetical protein